MKQILLAYGLPKETVAGIIMLHEDNKTMTNSLDGDNDFFDIVVEVL